jgi:Dyp-type peroxidase family
MVPYNLRYKAQANILKSHGRQFMDLILLQFATEKSSEIQAILFKLCYNAGLPFKVINSNQAQLVESELYNNEPGDNSPQESVVVTLHFSSKGLDIIGKTNWVTSEQLIFKRGMKHVDSRDNLKDPPVKDWEENYKQDLHALFTVASNSSSNLESFVETVRCCFEETGLGQVLFTESGAKMRRGEHVVEPFGYRDNISNPTFFSKQKLKKRKKDKTSKRIEISYAGSPNKYKIALDDKGGSFLVFRKLQQQCLLFEELVCKLASILNISRSYAEAQIMGRFKDGTPLAIVERAGVDRNKDHEEIFKKIGYSQDPNGTKCPFHAHVRKANPRTERDFLWTNGYQTIDKDIFGIIVRRGMPYEYSVKETGLLFLCYQRNIGHQFQVVQKDWSNAIIRKIPSPTGPKKISVGLDPISGQFLPNVTVPNHWNTVWGKDHKIEETLNFSDTVTFKGGEFFYAPSVRQLKGLRNN